MERMLRDRYLTLVDKIAARLDASNLEAAVALASYPDEIRGYGPVKDESVHRAEARVGALRSLFDGVS
jgi:indolepyruvate ferredoxin oxidoreductase